MEQEKGNKSRKRTINKPAVRKIKKKQKKIEKILEKSKIKKEEAVLLDFIAGFLEYRCSVLEGEYEKADSCLEKLEEIKKNDNFDMGNEDLTTIKCAVIYKNPEKNEKRTRKELDELRSRVLNRR